MGTVSVAYFITPHGYGHAARAAAVMAAMLRIRRDIRFELFTTCPAWLFSDTLNASFGYHCVQTDVGMVQSSPVTVDLEATGRALDAFLPFDATRVDDLAQRLLGLDCRLVVCDISALGIVAAQKARLPAVLVENFTWDWIYWAYAPRVAGLKAHCRYLSQIYRQVDLRIQSEPLCQFITQGACQVNPISRLPRSRPEEIRDRLKIPPGAKCVLVSMGGVPDQFAFISRLPRDIGFFILIPGAEGAVALHPRVIALPAHSSFYHPDLIFAADALVGKAGYSTIAEAYYAGLPYGHVDRPGYPESPALARFIDRQMTGCPISGPDYASGRWIESVPALLTAERRPSGEENGAEAVARMLCDRLS
jgi:hypothetical protein